MASPVTKYRNFKTLDEDRLTSTAKKIQYQLEMADILRTVKREKKVDWKMLEPEQKRCSEIINRAAAWRLMKRVLPIHLSMDTMTPKTLVNTGILPKISAKLPRGAMATLTQEDVDSNVDSLHAAFAFLILLFKGIDGPEVKGADITKRVRALEESGDCIKRRTITKKPKDSSSSEEMLPFLDSELRKRKAELISDEEENNSSPKKQMISL